MILFESRFESCTTQIYKQMTDFSYFSYTNPIIFETVELAVNNKNKKLSAVLFFFFTNSLTSQHTLN